MGICFLQIIFDIQVEEIDKAKKKSDRSHVVL